MTAERRPTRAGRQGYSVWTGVLIGLVIALVAMVVFSFAIALADHHHIAEVIRSPLLALV